MAFVPKQWKNAPDHSTPLDAAGLIDLEVRVTDYADLVSASALNIAKAYADTLSWEGGPGVFPGELVLPLTVTSDDPGHVPLTLKGDIGQAADLLELKDSDDAVQASFGLERFSLGGPATARLPFNVNVGINGPDAIAEGVTNLVGVNNTASFTGDFTGIGGADPGFGWGWEIFTMTGDAPGDAAGLVDLTSGNVELALRSPDIDLAHAAGMTTSVSWWGAAADGHIGSMESLRVTAPTRKEGSTGGTADIAVGAFFEEAVAAAVGATSALTILVDGGTSRFAGVMDVREASSGLVGLGSAAFTVAAGYDAGDPQLALLAGTGGGHVVVNLNTASALFEVDDGDMKTGTAGKGYIAISPDGTKTKRISIDNSGAVVATAP